MKKENAMTVDGVTLTYEQLVKFYDAACKDEQFRKVCHDSKLARSTGYYGKIVDDLKREIVQVRAKAVLERAKEVNGFDETKRVIPNPSEIYIFLDSNAGKIYLKQMNSENGRAEYLTYNIDKTDDTAKDPIEAINERLSAIESKIGGLYESVSGNAKIQSVQGEPDGYADGQFHPEPVRANGTAESAEISANPTDVKRKERKPAS